MTPLGVVLLVIALLLLVLVVGGVIAAGRRQRAREAHLQAQLSQANEALALARADDRGWDRDVLEAAARAAAGGRVDALDLVQVQDRPGTEEDRAIFRVVRGGREDRLVLGRHDGAWLPVQAQSRRGDSNP